MQISANLRELAKEARQLADEAERAKSSAENGAVKAIEAAWQCGKRLNAIKEIVGYGKFTLWREGNLPRLAERTAQNYMKIDADNPNALRVADLKFDSIRKYRIASFVPEKKRAQLKGDKKFDRSAHHLAVVVECNKLTQRIDAGQYEVSESELLRDFNPFYLWLRKKYAGGG